MLKTCPACKEAKPLDAFSRQTKSKDGRYPYCKVCAKAKTQALYRARGKRSWMEDKTCSWCKTLKPRTTFRKDDLGKPVARCMDCETEISVRTSAGERRCNICREWLPLGRFYPSKLKFAHVACQECTKAQVAQPKYKSRRRAFVLMKEYGITLEQYDELVAKQNGGCPVCLNALPPDRAGHVDHVHGGAMKGRIRAIVHRDCNRFVLWTHEDSAQLRRAADLIDNPLTDWVVPNPTSNERAHEKERIKK